MQRLTAMYTEMWYANFAPWLSKGVSQSSAKVIPKGNAPIRK